LLESVKEKEKGVRNHFLCMDARELRRADGKAVATHIGGRGVARVESGERAQDAGDDGDDAAFERVLAQACERVSMRLLAYGVMPNHWHLVVWPRGDGDRSRFMNRLTLPHTQRWHQHRHTVGEGHVYQGRLKSFPVETGEHLLTVGRYVERNPVRAGLVVRAEQWRWSSAGHRVRAGGGAPLSDWPRERPAD
jgi:putative transposase